MTVKKSKVGGRFNSTNLNQNLKYNFVHFECLVHRHYAPRPSISIESLKGWVHDNI